MITDSVENAGQRPETGNLGKEPVARAQVQDEKGLGQADANGMLLENPSEVVLWEHRPGVWSKKPKDW